MQKTKGMRPPLWRRKYVVNFKFQAAFIRKALFVAGFILVSQWFALQYIFVRFNIYAEELSYDQRKQFYEFLSAQTMMLNQTFLWMCLFTPICIFLWGVFQSHRIAGPLYNLKSRLHKMREITDVNNFSQLEETQFRRSDYFHELADEYNKTINHLKVLVKDSGNESNVVNLKSYSKKEDKKNKAA